MENYIKYSKNKFFSIFYIIFYIYFNYNKVYKINNKLIISFIIQTLTDLLSLRLVIK